LTSYITNVISLKVDTLAEGIIPLAHTAKSPSLYFRGITYRVIYTFLRPMASYPHQYFQLYSSIMRWIHGNYSRNLTQMKIISKISYCACCLPLLVLSNRVFSLQMSSWLWISQHITTSLRRSQDSF